MARPTEVADPRTSRRLVDASKERAPGGAEHEEWRIGVPRVHVALGALVWPLVSLLLAAVLTELILRAIL